jgi:hypothetical protein
MARPDGWECLGDIFRVQYVPPKMAAFIRRRYREEAKSIGIILWEGHSRSAGDKSDRLKVLLSLIAGPGFDPQMIEAYVGDDDALRR